MDVLDKLEEVTRENNAITAGLVEDLCKSAYLLFKTTGDGELGSALAGVMRLAASREWATSEEKQKFLRAAHILSKI